MTRTRQQLSKQLIEFQANNQFTDHDVAMMVGTDVNTIIDIRLGDCEWIEIGVFRRLTMVMGE